jgi:FkbM family methyltransferase
MGISEKTIKFFKPAMERFPIMALAFRYIRDNRRIFHTPVKTPMGFRFIGNRGMENGSFEPEETEIVKKILPSIDVFVNVGANIGYFCCLALHSGKHAVAFEPIASNLRYLYKNIHANHWMDKIEVFPMALSNQMGLTKIFGGGTGASLLRGWAGTPANYVSVVPVSTLNNVLSGRFGEKNLFILVDIEGAEKLMLEGATCLLAREPKPIWMVEISVSEHQPAGIAMNPHLFSTFKLFWDNGYASWTADKHLRRIKPDEVKEIVRTGNNTLRTHNFLFMDKGIKRKIWAE